LFIEMADDAIWLCASAGSGSDDTSLCGFHPPLLCRLGHWFKRRLPDTYLYLQVHMSRPLPASLRSAHTRKQLNIPRWGLENLQTPSFGQHNESGRLLSANVTVTADIRDRLRPGPLARRFAATREFGRGGSNANPGRMMVSRVLLQHSTSTRLDGTLCPLSRRQLTGRRAVNTCRIPQMTLLPVFENAIRGSRDLPTKVRVASDDDMARL